MPVFCYDKAHCISAWQAAAGENMKSKSEFEEEGLM
jgi:hypothetical protein